MSSPTETESTIAGRGRWQVSLADLSFVVLAAGLGAGIARGARDVWGMRSVTPTGPTAVPFGRTAGLVVEVAAVWLAMVLARGMVGIVRARRGSGLAATPGRRPAAMAWRGLGIILLLGLAMGEASVLRLNQLPSGPRPYGLVGWREWYQLRESLIPVCSILAVIGLALGAGARPGITREGPPRRRPYWLFVPLAALAGVLVIGRADSWWGMITQLVLIALEAVNNARAPAYQATSDAMSVRMVRAGIEAIPCAAACLWLALVVARDFEWTRMARPPAMTRIGSVFRFLSIATALAGGAFSALVAIPTIHPHFFRSLCWIMEPEVVGMVLAGFGLFSAGLAARTVVPPSGRPRPRWATRLARTAWLALFAVLMVSALQCLPASTQLDPAVPSIVGVACDLGREVPAWLWSLIPDSGQISFAAWLDPERLAWTLATSAVILFVLELVFSRTAGDRSAPFDAVAESPGRLGRFLWLTGSLTAVCLISLPTLIVLGQVMVHIRLNIGDWMAFGWPSPF